MRAEIIAVGSELLTSSRTETNSLYITQKLSELGIDVGRKFVVADRIEEIREAFAYALQRAEIILFSGGLGPTNDDLTREAIADQLGLDLTENSSILEDLLNRYRHYGVELTKNNRRQAAVPTGATVLSNPLGTAPGLFLKTGDVIVFLLPGPPRELFPMVEHHVLPLIRQHKSTTRLLTRQVKVAGIPESKVDEMVEDIYKSFAPEISTTILASVGVISLYFSWKSPLDPEKADARLDRLVELIDARLGRAVFSHQEEELEEAIGRMLRSRGYTLATAESCTGGLIGKMLTDAPGSSDYFKGGVIAYDNLAKGSLLGVDQKVLDSQGAVSAAVAAQMASGVRRRFDSAFGLSVTGIAGPGGGTQEKPVGLVFLGISGPSVDETQQLNLPGSRETVRLRAARAALDWLRRRLV